MSISGLRKRLGAPGFSYLAAAASCAVFSAVYEHFSHSVYSPWMVCLFLWPLVLGGVPFALLRLDRDPRAGEAARSLWCCGVGTLTAGSLITGVMEIFGGKSEYSPVYWTAGGVLLLAAAAAFFLGSGRAEKTL